MQTRDLSAAFVELCALVALATLMAASVAAQETILYSFGPMGTDASSPYGSLIFDAAGNLYGTAHNGGTFGGGAVFELSPVAGGGWTESVLHNFKINSNDGWYPFASLIFDAAGNLYGATTQGGVHSGGIVFELSPNSNGSWTEKSLHNFTLNSTTDGFLPFGTLVFDGTGNLYGTAAKGGHYGGGIAFELSPSASGPWKETVLHAFASAVNDGSYPTAALVLDSAGNLYGTTQFGGAHGVGTVFELSPHTGGHWKEDILHTFNNNGTDGYQPNAGVILDSAGNVYGTTSYGGINFVGTVYELKPAAGGHWTEAILSALEDENLGGDFPQGLPVFDSAGNLYGTTPGGSVNGNGNVFELTPATHGPWTETVLYNFDGFPGDGFSAFGALILDSTGNLYGTTSGGGAFGFGTVFEIAH